MSSGFNGDTFSALDGECFADDFPLDAFLDAALRSNAIWLASRGSQITWAPYCTNASDPSDGDGTRPYASADWSSVLNLPWLVQPGLTGVTLALVARSAGEDGSTPSAASLVTTRTSLPAFGRSREESILKTESSSTQFGGHVLGALELAQEVVAPLVTDLRLEVRSRSYGSPQRVYTSPDTAPSPGTLMGVAGTYDDTDAGSVRPNDDDLHLHVTDVADSDGIRHDHLAATDDDTMLVRAVGGGPARSGPSGEMRRLSYLQVRSVEITETYDGADAVLDAARYRPGRIVEGADELAHALANRTVHERARCVAIMPMGRIDDGSLWPDDYGPRFGRLSSTPGGSEQQWFRGDAYLDRDAATVRLLVNALPTHAAHSGAISTMEALREAGATATWTIGLEVEQFEDNALGGVASQVGAGEVEVELTHWPLESSGTWAALASERWLEVNKASAQESHPYKEGQLFAEDYGLLQLVDVTAPVTLTGSSDSPVYLRVTATLDTSSVSFGTDGGDAAELRLTCTGATAWEVS